MLRLFIGSGNLYSALHYTVVLSCSQILQKKLPVKGCGNKATAIETPNQTYLVLQLYENGYFASIKGLEIMRMFCKGQLDIWTADPGLKGEVRLIERQFGVYSAA